MTEFTDNIDKCGLVEEVDHVCAPNQCRIDNGYGSYCDSCMCSSCTRSDCHKENFDTFTVVCYGCVHACKVEFLEAELTMPEGCVMDKDLNNLVKWEYL